MYNKAWKKYDSILQIILLPENFKLYNNNNNDINNNNNNDDDDIMSYFCLTILPWLILLSK